MMFIMVQDQKLPMISNLIHIGRSVRLVVLLNQITEIDKSGLGWTSSEVDAFIKSLIVGGVPKYQGQTLYNVTIKLLGNEAPSSDADVLAAIEILSNTPYFNNLELTSSGHTIVNAELTTYITGLSVELSDTQLKNLDDMITSLKTVDGGITNLSDFFDVLWIWGGETASSSVKNIVADNYHSVPTNSPAWTKYEGYTGDVGNSAYLDLIYDQSNQSNFELDSASIGVYCRTVGATGVLMGSAGSSATFLSPSTGWNRINAGNNNVAGTPSNTDGVIILTRTSSTDVAYYYNGNKTTDEITSTSKNFGSPTALARESSSYFSNAQLSIGFYSKSINDADEAIIRNAFETYMDANGKGVIT